MTKDTKINTDAVEIVKLLSRKDVEDEFGEAVASVNVTDRSVTWAKFTLTDDKPNENNQRVPFEEFDNILKTGQYKPIKMALGEIADGHDDAKPLGVITHVTKQVGNEEGGKNKIIALAALWNHERTDDVAMVRDRIKSNKPVNVSWEILYGDHRVVNGVEDLLDTILKAVTIVGIPAYAGRTQILAVAATKWSPAYIEKLPDTSFLHIDTDGNRYFAYRDDTGKIAPSRFQSLLGEITQAPLPEETKKTFTHQVKKMASVVEADASIQELLNDGEEFITEEYTLDTKELESKVTDLETKLAQANDVLAQKENELKAAQDKVATAENTVTELTKEIEPLRQFKLEADEAIARKTRLDGIKAKFATAGIEKDDEYFETNADNLLGLEESRLDFMIQELVAFKGTEGRGEASTHNTTIPNVPGANNGTLDIKDLASALRERKTK